MNHLILVDLTRAHCDEGGQIVDLKLCTVSYACDGQLAVQRIVRVLGDEDINCQWLI